MKKFFESISVLVLSGLVFLLFFQLAIPAGLSNINNYFFSTNHDGIKNYYTYLYYLKYDSGFHFSGMAYPYGDLITFTDNQPLLVLFIRCMDTFGFQCSNHALLIFNGLLLLALPLTAWMVYKLLRHYGVTLVYAFFIALAITFLNPQIERLAGHYALAYGFVIPLFWLLDIRVNRTEKQWLWITLTIFIVLAFTFLHVYYLAVALIFYSFSGIARAMISDRSKKTLLHIAAVYIQVALLPMAIFKIFLLVIDPVKDRVAFPYGFVYHRASYRSLFFSSNSPFDRFIPDFIKVGKLDLEGHAYLGVFALAFSIYVIFTFVRHTIREKRWNFNQLNLTGNDSFKPYIILAFLALCIGTAFPFYMPPFDVVIEWVTPLAQFRSPGRFAWIFFFLFTIFFYLTLYRIARNSPSRIMSFLFPLVILISLFEGVWFSAKKLIELNETTLGSEFLKNDLEKPIAAYGLDTSQFQALVVFPFFAIGTEKAGCDGTNHSILYAMKTSYHTGLPLVNYMMSRTSVSEGLEIAQLTGNAFIHKEYPARLAPGKPLLLLTTDSTSAEEDEIARAARFLFRHNDMTFYQLDPGVFEQIYRNKQQQVLAASWHPVANQDNVFSNDTQPALFIRIPNISLDQLADDDEHDLDKTQRETIFEGQLPATDSLSVSVWVRTVSSRYGFPHLKVTEFGKNGKPVFTFNTYQEKRSELYRNMRRHICIFKPQDSSHTVCIEVEGQKYNFSNLVICNAGKDFIYPDKNNTWYWNNFPSEISLMPR